MNHGIDTEYIEIRRVQNDVWSLSFRNEKIATARKMRDGRYHGKLRYRQLAAPINEASLADFVDVVQKVALYHAKKRKEFDEKEYKRYGR